LLVKKFKNHLANTNNSTIFLYFMAMECKNKLLILFYLLFDFKFGR